MARPLRIVVPGGWYHVVNRGNRREAIFLRDADRKQFLGRIAELPERFRVQVHAFVLMDNHYHLLIRITEPNLSQAIQWLQLSYTVRFNLAHAVQGHLFQGRFRAMHLQGDAEAIKVARYVHLNPVRIEGLGLGKAEQRRARVADLPDPGGELVARRIRTLTEYPWSSWRVYGGYEPAPPWLETEFVSRACGGRSRRERLAALRQHTEAPIRQGHVERPWDHLVGGSVLGDVDYAKALFQATRSNPQEQTEARALRREGRPDWETLVAAAEEECGEKWVSWAGRHGDWTRDAVLYVAVRHAGYRLSEIHGRIPGLKYQAAAQALKRMQKRLETDARCRAFVRRLAGKISNI